MAGGIGRGRSIARRQDKNANMAELSKALGTGSSVVTAIFASTEGMALALSLHFSPLTKRHSHVMDTLCEAREVTR